MQPRISVVVPVYNSAASLSELHQRIQRVLSTTEPHFELIFVDDASPDDTWTRLEEIRSRDHRVKIIQLMRNFGQHNALMCGLTHACGDYIITMDDDLQNPPEEIPKLLTKISEGYDLVYGTYVSKQHGGLRNFGSWLIQQIYRKVFKGRVRITAFRILSRRLVESLKTYDKSYVFLDGLLAWSTARISEVQVEHHPRQHGKSGYSVMKLVTLALNMITNFSIVPLQIASILGFLFALVGFVLGLFFLLKKIFFGIPVEGFTSIIIAVTLFSGIQLITLGLLGEYMGRIHLNINAKPQYEIRCSHLGDGD